MRSIVAALCILLFASPVGAQLAPTDREVGRLYTQLLDLWEVRSIEGRRSQACALKDRAEQFRERQRAVAQAAETALFLAQDRKAASTIEEGAAHVQAKVLLDEASRVTGYAQALCFTYDDPDLQLAN